MYAPHVSISHYDDTNQRVSNNARDEKYGQ